MQKIEAGDQNPCLNGSDNSSDVSKAVLDSRQKFLDSIQVVTSNLVYEFESKFLSFQVPDTDLFDSFELPNGINKMEGCFLSLIQRKVCFVSVYYGY